MMLMDAVLRLVPGVLGDIQSAEQDSFSDGLLDCPHYTKPRRIPRHDGSRGLTLRKSWLDCRVAIETIAATHFRAPT